MNTNELHSVHTYQYQSGLISEDDIHFRDAAQLAEYHAHLENLRRAGMSIKFDKQLDRFPCVIIPARSDYD